MSNILNTIQHYIDVYSGSEKRVLSETKADLNVSDSNVASCLQWLREHKYIELVDAKNMTDSERTYYESDKYTFIYRNIKYYDQVKYYEEEKKRKDKEDTLSNIDKFKLFFNRMEEHFAFEHLFNNKKYKLTYETNNVLITIDGKDTLKIDFSTVEDIFFTESDYCIYYKLNGQYFTLELYYLWGNCILKHYCSS